MSGEVNLGEIDDWKAVGNKLSDQALSQVREVDKPKTRSATARTFCQPVEAKPISRRRPLEPARKSRYPRNNCRKTGKKEGLDKASETFKPGDTIEFD